MHRNGLRGLFCLFLLGAATSAFADGPPGGWIAAGPPAVVVDVAVDRAEGHLFALTADGVYRSDDHARTWRLLPDSPTSAVSRTLAVDPASPLRVLAAGCGVRESQDGGVHWVDASTGLPAGCSLSFLEPDPSAVGRFLAAGAAGLFRGSYGSSGAAEWTPLDPGAPLPLQGIAASVYDGVLLVAAGDGGIYLGRDGGTSWSRRGTLPAATSVRRLHAWDALNDEAATDVGLWTSADGGATWAPFEPLFGFGVGETLTIPGGRTYAATDRGVLWLVADVSFRWVDYSEGLPPNTALRRILADSTGRHLAALASDGRLFRAAYPLPVLRLEPLPSVIRLGGQSVPATIDPPQPVPLELRVSSDDPTVVPEARWTISSFAASTGVFIPAVRTSVAPVHVTVSLSPEFGGQSVSFPVAVWNPVPAVSSLYPPRLEAGSASFALTVWDYFSSSFVADSVITWNGSPRPTRLLPPGPCPLLCPSVLVATIGAADVANAGTATVSVINPGPGGGTSNLLTVTIDSPAPVRCDRCRRPRPVVVGPRGGAGS